VLGCARHGASHHRRSDGNRLSLFVVDSFLERVELRLLLDGSLELRRGLHVQSPDALLISLCDLQQDLILQPGDIDPPLRRDVATSFLGSRHPAPRCGSGDLTNLRRAGNECLRCDDDEPRCDDRTLRSAPAAARRCRGWRRARGRRGDWAALGLEHVHLVRLGVDRDRLRTRERRHRRDHRVRIGRAGQMNFR